MWLIFLQAILILFNFLPFSGDSIPLINFVPCESTKREKSTKLLPIKPASTTPYSPSERGLLNSTTISAQSILDNFLTTMKHVRKQFPNKVMAFVAPEHKNGYKVAIKNRGKINIISPAWYIIKFEY